MSYKKYSIALWAFWSEEPVFSVLFLGMEYALWIGIGFIFVGGMWWLAVKQGMFSRGSSGGGFIQDMTEQARAGAFDHIEGRDQEIERTLHILMRRTKNNPLLLGAPGVGKTAIVEGLAQRIVAGDVPEAMKTSRIMVLDLAAVMAETKYRGELEKRLHGLLREYEKTKTRTILFIDEFHTLVQVGAAEGAVNMVEIFKPALARGGVQIIGATTWDEYTQHIRPNAALDRRLQPVLVDEPSPEQAFEMLKVLRPAYEKFHNVEISDDVLLAAVHLSHEKIHGRYLPDKAIDLMDEAAAKVAIECSRVEHGASMAVLHGAAKSAQVQVSVEDIENVLDQWVMHDSEDARRDARNT